MYPIKAKTYPTCDYVFKTAHTEKELAGFWEVRKKTFCDEQNIFEDSDRDEFDDTMIPIVCNSLIMGMEDQVVGAVRIDERESGIWWGSRLCVDSAFRRVRFSPSVSVRGHMPSRWNSVGAGLIYKAVTTANLSDCTTFLATVQLQNVKFFQRLRWEPLEEVIVHGLPHVKMQADLNYYPASHNTD